MSAANELKITAGHTYRTHSDRLIYILGVEGWRVHYRVESGLGQGETHWSSYVDLSHALAEDVTP